MQHDIDILRQAGFFKEEESLSDTDLINKLKEKRKQAYSKTFGYDYDPVDFLTVIDIISMDDKKFIDIDMEADVLNGNNAYVRVLKLFAIASGGYFNPMNIEETWQTDEGPISVRFLSNDQEITFEPQYLDDWLDEQIFEIINQQMKVVCNEQFVFCAGPNNEWAGQNATFVRLTEEQVSILKEKLNWIFYS